MKLFDWAATALAEGAEVPAARLTWRRASCAVLGHHVDNHALAQGGPTRTCRCGTPYLTRDGAVTRVRHTLSCFLGHHEYVPLVDRNGAREYVCDQCGHPLVLSDHTDPYRGVERFTKRVRYLCGLLGHRVRTVTRRDGLVEYACHCGHTFLKPGTGESVIHHPLVCVAGGHWVRFVTARRDYDEFVCVNCGHPFCFARSRQSPAGRWYSEDGRRKTEDGRRETGDGRRGRRRSRPEKAAREVGAAVLDRASGHGIPVVGEDLERD